MQVSSHLRVLRSSSSTSRVTRPGWATVEEELFHFPHSTHDDVVDCFSMAAHEVIRTGEQNWDSAWGIVPPSMAVTDGWRFVSQRTCTVAFMRPSSS